MCRFRFIVYFGALFLLVLRFCFFFGVFPFCGWLLLVSVAPFPYPLIVVFHVLCIFVCCLLCVCCYVPHGALILVLLIVYVFLLVRLRYYGFPCGRNSRCCRFVLFVFLLCCWFVCCLLCCCVCVLLRFALFCYVCLSFLVLLVVFFRG